MIIQPAKIQEGMMMSMMMEGSVSQVPFPNGQPPLESIAEYEASLRRTLPGVKIEEVLLSIQSRPDTHQGQGYEVLITDPIYQLR